MVALGGGDDDGFGWCLVSYWEAKGFRVRLRRVIGWAERGCPGAWPRCLAVRALMGVRWSLCWVDVGSPLLESQPNGWLMG